MRLAMVQRFTALGDKAKNLATLEKAVRSAKADLCVFGEMFLTGYSNRDRHIEMAETLGGPSVRRLRKLAKSTGSHIVLGMPEKDADIAGLVYNSAVLIRPDGEPSSYRKWYLPNFGPFEEKMFFTEGKGLGIERTSLGKIGLSICYDLFFPEICKAEALQGADLLVAISASPSPSKKFFEAVIPARAIENATPLVYVNHIGTENAFQFWGGSVCYDARGNVRGKAKYYKEDTVTVELDLDDTALARAHRPTIRDTRAEAFRLIESMARAAHVR